MSMPEFEEELRYVKKKRGAHRPASKGTGGYDRDLWQGDGNNETQGPTESRPADDVLARLEATEAELTAAKEEKERLRAQRDAARRRRADVEAENAAYVSAPVAVEPSAGEQFLEGIIRAAVEGAFEAVEEALSTPEGRQALAELGRRAWNSATTFGRRLFALGRKGIAGAELSALPSADDASTELSVVPATENSAHDERPRFAMSREEYRERLLAFMALKEAAARMGQVLQDADVEGVDLPSDLESVIQAALNGQAVDLSPEVNELLMEFLMSPYDANGFQIAEVCDPVERDDDT